MKIYLRLYACLCFILLTPHSLLAQTVVESSNPDSAYYARKRLLLQNNNTSRNESQPAGPVTSQALAASSCFIENDASYATLPRNDDGSSSLITLPFTYSLYGTPYTQLYINTNGNITFSNPLPTYTASGFPISTPMVAAFWADVDTENPLSGQIHYKIFPTRLIVTWDSVGYFSSHADKKNTFQIIITNGADPLIGIGNNTAFYYKDMQWTTGDLSGGVGGFGGSPATVGINKGNSINYIQIGRFSVNSSVYDGPGGNNDGVNYLDNQCFTFDVSTTSTNIPPSVNNFPTINNITLNAGESYELAPQFIGPEVNQTVTTTIDTSNFCRVTYTVTNGIISQVTMKITADTCNVGTHVVTFRATDNGSPVQSTVRTLTVNVNKLNQTITFTPPAEIPANSSTITLNATASSRLPVQYSVLSGPATVSGNVLTLTGVGLVTVRAMQPGNAIYNAAPPKDAAFCILPSQPSIISGDTLVCINALSPYMVTNVPGANFSWTVDGGGTVTSSGNTASIRWNALGTYIISVNYSTNCGTSGVVRRLTVRVTNNPLSGAFSKMLPADGKMNLSFPINFSWLPITNASYYDIYIWPEAANRPANPYISGISGINYTLASPGTLEYEKIYKWQVVARSICNSLESPVQTFRLAYLPDIVVNNIQVPLSGFSGQSLTVRWEIKNTGQGRTLNQQWFDQVYLSRDAVLDKGQDFMLGSVANVSELGPNNSYAQSATFTLPQGISDNYYVFVETNAFGQLKESNLANNTSISNTTSAIQLTPPPDLQVSSIIPPNFAFSGQPVTVSWKVSNAGPGQTVASSWTDQVYFSKEPQLNLSTAGRMGTFGHTGALRPGENYTQASTFTLPEGIFGNYYFFVVTDVANQVYEHVFEQNNTGRSDSIKIILTPPIDLVVTQVVIPQKASNGETISVSWQVENAGGSSTENRSWTDIVYISPSAVFDPGTARFLGSAARPQALAVGDSYTTQRSYAVPSGITGDYYIYVRTDASNTVYEYTYENNNVTRSAQKLSVVSPDLVVTDIVLPAADTSGHPINIAWTVKNDQAGTLFNSGITDRILLSASAVFDPANSRELRLVGYSTGEIISGASVTRQASVKLPNGISGNYYVYIYTDYYNSVYETSNDNNIKRSTSPINIVLGPWPDLQVAAVQAGDSATAGDVIPISYQIVNKGTGNTNNVTWTDRIYISTNPQYSTTGSTFVRDISQRRPLSKDSSYTVSTSIRIPTNFGDTTYYVHVFTDVIDSVYEHTDEGNNTGRSRAVYIKKYPPVDLAVTAISAPDSGRSGVPVKVRWTVRNKGQAPTLQAYWSDAVFLSADTLFDSSDRLVREFTHQGVLNPATDYTNEQNVVLPNGISGSYYLLLVTDRANLNNDVDRSNNYKLIRQTISNGDSTNNPIPISIVLTSPPDLFVSSLTVPDEGTAGQPVKIRWKVKNAGPGTTAVSSWTEKVYISTNVDLDASARIIGNYVRSGALASGEEYEDSLQVFLPMAASGNYVIIFKTDANDNVYEHGAEENTDFSLITVAQSPLSDLVVEDVQAPAMAMAGEDVTIQWKVKNTGANPASGIMQESVYLSADSLQDVSDILIGSTAASINLAPQAGVSRSAMGKLNGVSLKDYYVLVHTDIFNNIAEASDSNNVSASQSKMMVTVPQLAINVPAQKALQNNVEVYYRIEIPDSLAGESLLVALKGDSLQGANELYLRYGEVPTRAVHDYSHSQPYQGNQEVIIPELKAGTYYLMAYGNTAAGSMQQAQLLASILRFEIRGVNAAQGGNTGQVTLQLNGSKLGTVNSVRLVGAAGEIEADSIKVGDPTKIYATFNLRGKALGTYNLLAKNEKGDTTSLPQSFTIVPGSADNLIVNVITPPNTRPSNIISLTVQFTNAGNTDIVNPVLRLISLAGAPIGFTVSGLENNTKELTLLLQELNGPTGLLRPGASGTTIIYSKATTALGYMLLKSNSK